MLCLLCHENTLKFTAICRDCDKILPRLGPIYHPDFNNTVILFDYLFPADTLITQLKFQFQLTHATLLGKLLSKKIFEHYHDQPLPELIIPIPLHKKRLQERGFNQAVEIAKPISKILNIPLDKYSTIRKKHTAAQSLLSQKERVENIKNAFEVKKPLQATHVAIVDDVMTTGETLKTFAALLRKNHIEKIDVWCCARTPYI